MARPSTSTGRAAGALRRDDVSVSRVNDDQLCRDDMVTLLDPVTRMARGLVVLGGFRRYDPVRQAVTDR